jgi:hypothetical protein
LALIDAAITLSGENIKDESLSILKSNLISMKQYDITTCQKPQFDRLKQFNLTINPQKQVLENLFQMI